MRLLLGGLIASVALSALPAQAQVSDTQVGALVEALRRAAPQTGTKNDGLYSEWQIKPANIPRWSKQCTGRELTVAQFEESPTTAREILVCVMRDVLREQYRTSGNNETVAVQRAASWWMTGDPTRYNNAPTASYTQQVLNFYQQASSNRSESSASNQPKPASQPITQPSAQNATQSSSAVSNAQVGALVEALRRAAPKTGTKNDGLYSEWQVTPEIIPSWSKQCIGRELTPTQFEANSATARSIVSCITKRELQKQYLASGNNETAAVRRTACWWMTGKATGCNSGPTAAYTQNVIKFYQQASSNRSAQSPASNQRQPAAN
jgi:hypothetical protein